MNILLLGNGFDIDNNFPTKYKDFIEFIDNLLKIKNKIETSGEEVDENVIDEICENENHNLNSYYYSLFTNKLDIKNKFISLLENNAWYLHFSKKKLEGDKWLDFETEIDNIMDVLKKINDSFERIGEHSNELTVNDGILEIINMLKISKKSADGKVENYKISDSIQFKKTLFSENIEKLYDDLNDLTEGFRNYLIDYVNKLPIEYYNPDICKINPNLVLSFNYTNTYKRHFIYRRDANCYHINGDAEYFENGNNNLVLGIETDDRIFFRFEKSWQRVNKGEYKNSLNKKNAAWLDIIENNEEKSYIFLDIR